MNTEKYLAFIAPLILLVSFSIMDCFAQESIRINFQKDSPGDYDIMLKDVLVKNGYDVIINYKYDSLSYNNSDYVLNYTVISRETRDELHKYTLTLSKNGHTINEVNKTLNPINGVNAPREMCKALEKLLGKNLNFKEYTFDNEVKYLNIDFQVRKLDDGIYIIIAKGAGIRTLDAVKDAFFKKAQQYLNHYDYYIETGKYNYSAHGYITTHHTGNMVAGIIIRNTTESGINELAEIPEQLASYIE